ncbi:MAG: hypothetical protein JRN06_06465 [Nitrososphaerota archaeon]|nr:hypothetical protein [Nitrososphaerota archaeon]
MTKLAQYTSNDTNTVIRNRALEDLFENRDYLSLMKMLVSGEAVSINFSDLSRILRIHRNTIKKRVQNLFDHQVLHSPFFPFLGLYKVYPLLVVVRISLPDDGPVVKWVQEDPYIFAAFKSRHGEYNILLFAYHESVASYQSWVESLPSVLKLQYGIQDYTCPMSTPTYFSNARMTKYDPSSGMRLLEREFNAKGELVINGYGFDKTDVDILKCLVAGKGIKVNHTLLCKETRLHRKTISNRISELTKVGLLGSPACRFPNLFVPPNYVLTFSQYEIKEPREKVLREVSEDPCIPIAMKIAQGKYNFLVFGNHLSISDHLKWEEGYRERFPDSIGSAEVTYLSPEMTIAFDQQIVSLSFLEKRLETSRGREIRRSIGRAQ